MTAAIDRAITEEARALMSRIRGEYLEMPGLRLTLGQAQRLWGLDRQQCVEVLDRMTAARILQRTRDGSFILA